jgi:hypothetical protein
MPEVRVVDVMPKKPPAEVVYLMYRDGSGGTYWRWRDGRWEPMVVGTSVPPDRKE